MEVIERISALRARLGGGARPVGLVPTMGNLHAGHAALVRACRAGARAVVVSVFVNPTQFAPGEDFERYPRTLDADLRLLADLGVDLVFAPRVAEMYPHGQRRPVVVSVPALTGLLCGASRPGHFDGVATVVAKLFNIVAPERAYFGEKDWQQLAIVRAMARQLDMPVEVLGVPTVRAPSGLALSSRNSYLTDAERQTAPLLHSVLQEVASALRAGEGGGGGVGIGVGESRRLERDASDTLTAAGFAVDYVAVRDAASLLEPDADAARLRVLAAARLGRARLIDNVGVGVER